AGERLVRVVDVALDAAVDEDDLRGGVASVLGIVATESGHQFGPVVYDEDVGVVGGGATGRTGAAGRPAVVGCEALPGDGHGRRRRVRHRFRTGGQDDAGGHEGEGGGGRHGHRGSAQGQAHRCSLAWESAFHAIVVRLSYGVNV